MRIHVDSNALGQVRVESIRAPVRAGARRFARLTACVGLCLPVGLLGYSGGPPNGSTGGEFPGERLCSRCHQGAQAGSGSISFAIDGQSGGGFSYSPGQTVVLRIKASDPDAARIGFQLTARSGNGCSRAGELAMAPNGGSVRLTEDTCGDGTDIVQWISHRRPQSGDSAVFEVAWTAPQAGTGPVTIAAAVLAANGNLAPSGDSLYTLQATVEPGSISQGPPQIQEGGVVLGDNYSLTPRGVPGAMARVIGAELAASGTEASLTLDEQGRAPTILGGSCVLVNGRPAALSYVSPEWIDFQVPVETAVGTATVEVIRKCETPAPECSNQAEFAIAAEQPALFTFSATPPVVAARHADESPVGPRNLLPAIQASPAALGEVVSLFGTGFGAVTPALASGEIPTEPRQLNTSNIQVMLSDGELSAADVLYVGAAPGFLGAYQVDLALPAESLLPGDHPVAIVVNGVKSPVGPRLTVVEAPPALVGAACESGAVVLAGQSCRASFDGVAGTFSVDAVGKACISVPARNVNRCGSSEIALPRYGASAKKSASGGWSLTLPSSVP